MENEAAVDLVRHGDAECVGDCHLLVTCWDSLDVSHSGLLCSHFLLQHVCASQLNLHSSIVVPSGLTMI